MGDTKLSTRYRHHDSWSGHLSYPCGNLPPSHSGNPSHSPEVPLTACPSCCHLPPSPILFMPSVLSLSPSLPNTLYSLSFSQKQVLEVRSQHTFGDCGDYGI